MALIKCPECGREISDKAQACIHCGYPLAKASINPDEWTFEYCPNCFERDGYWNGYGLILPGRGPINEYQKEKSKIINWGLYEDPDNTSHQCKKCHSTFIRTKLTLAEMKLICKYIGGKTTYVELANKKESTGNDNVVQEAVEAKRKEAQRQQDIKAGKICPKCGSSNVTTGARGANGLLGFIGASKTVNRCGACGHKWEPRK